MAQDKLTRRLAVILHADVVGSTALVQRDETLAHQRIQIAFRQLSESIKAYNGETREMRGDALLAEFERASDAVTAALAFQVSNQQTNSAIEDDIKPRFRIGISLGEVIVADKTMTGAGVVLAQRIEQLADADGVCITEALHEALPDSMPFDLQSLGGRLLKGFEGPVQVYRAGLTPGKSIPAPEQVAARRPPSHKKLRAAIPVVIVLVLAALAYWLQPWQSGMNAEPPVADARQGNEITIAVLPFDNMSDDAEQSYFSDGITEDIITDLSQLQNLAVIARNSSFTYRDTSAKVQDIGKDLGARYLLEGSVRKAGNTIRITAQLIDAESGHHLWAERFDRQLTEIFDLQDEITEKIVAALSIQLSGEERQQLAKNATQSFEAYDLFLQAQIIAAGFNREGFAEAARLYRRAIELDPGFARAYGAMAIVLTRQVLYGFADSPAQVKVRAFELARKAVDLDPDSPHAQWALGYVYLYESRFDKAIEALQQAVKLSPSYADGFALLALIRNSLGHSEEAIRLIQKAIKLNPYYSWDYLYNLGRAYYGLEKYEQAIQYLRQALERNPTPRPARLYLIASLVHTGELEDAEWEVLQLEVSYPETSISHLKAGLIVANDDLLDRLTSDLRAAGMAE